MDKSSNAYRFIDTYNRVDKAIRDVFNLKPSISFSDAVRRSATMSSVVRKYEDDLVDYGRLRNAIVHRSSDAPIAEPHDDVLEKFEHISRIILTPPAAMQVVCSKSVTWFSADTNFGTALKEIYKTGYSNIPVYAKNTLVGVVTRKMIIDAFGKTVNLGKKLDDLLQLHLVDALDVGAVNEHYEVISEKATIDQVLFMFQQNRKLTTIILTRDGSYSAFPVGIIVTADVIDMQRILDNY